MGAIVQMNLPATRSALPDGTRVFDAECVSRLTLLNACARALRGLGYRVLAEEIAPRDGGRPTIHIGPYLAKSSDLLRERAGGISIQRQGNRQFASVIFMSVCVTWEIAA
ncbi:hypothetical protein [Burkholderia cenocepacia]|uniref:Uncharacterized protein n=1 Tax=Burkholderia cenocepacia TaxID=95486 RepID=A0A1V2VV11_9BURK|nr:hypothetical protein [Burkholderia cenocepacia]ONU48692.1 hypothetical protein A8E66_03690 [Burkholderia cenocepacia]ONU49930.1 hypothetical protein A8E67_38730 [Burkholderia cenocepacia]ONU51632.1 hypothetical protein A8E62_25710 [Burkholderia cenocepacia]ONU53358.1 hypothetical protein A8E68_36600 [Burkholderia cenocepacia]ONU77434.1 hypothetical protein A8E72_31710 [Burkholderia cenocepacia]